ncbi:peptidase E [Sinomicrobium weinanense]|uniref:Peptidase E n=1 Tax=Sinomicrobium weinanense TaxID=2842200 RepID=A0A926Q318_9FLAO|nr:peptidase E [Sinomicrobium weinanense]MBC9795536.1 peptidase E [Sinomicrobium weinanense]MBU3123317.1 peptidase E [Sinomicrobium weinanense]
MKIKTTVLSALFLLMFSISSAQGPDNAISRKIFAYGGQVNKEFIKYTAQLTGKKKPKICFLPTATGDNEWYINYWYELCHDLEVEPHVLKVWISSYTQKESFEEILTRMDAIIVGGGNTLNMLAIWKAQNIDRALEKAYEKGIILAGGSAGSLCWFNGGTTDSRPGKLSIVRGLGLLDYSHCPHYSAEKSRRPLYHDNISSDELADGYACDDKSGILFVNGKAEKAVSLDKDNHSYYVYKKDGKVVEEKMHSEILP